MKNIYLIGGTMGVGKTTVCQRLKKELKNSVFLDGDWCWDAHPFQVNEETKAMVMDNICYLLNNFIHSSAYENIVFCWVMHEQTIIDSIIHAIDSKDCTLHRISLITDENCLRQRLIQDIANGVRTSEVLEKSIARISMYQDLDTIKIDTTQKTIQEIVEEIKAIP